MADPVKMARAVNDGACELPEEFAPASLSQTQLKQQIAVYIEAAALKPLLSSGISLDQVAEALVEVAVKGVQRSKGRVAAALMLQRATRLAFKSVDADGPPRSVGTTLYRH
jgi:hypothetical protein